MRHENEIINGDFDNVVICAGVNTQTLQIDWVIK